MMINASPTTQINTMNGISLKTPSTTDAARATMMTFRGTLSWVCFIFITLFWGIFYNNAGIATFFALAKG